MGYCPNYIVRGENSSELGYCILGVAGKLLEVLKKKKNFFCKAETRLEELVSRHPFGVATWLRLGLKGPRSQHEIHVMTRIRLAAFKLEGKARVWWRWVRTSRDLEVMTWAEFQELFMGKYFPGTARHAKAQEFLELK